MIVMPTQGLSSQTVCVSTQGEGAALTHQMSLLAISNDAVNAEMQKTIQVFERFKEDSQTKNGALVRINETLCGQFIALESRLTEKEEVFQRNITAITQERDALRQEVTLLRQNMAAVTAQAEQRVAAEIAARIQEVRAANQVGEERERAARVEAEAALRRVDLVRAEAAVREAAALAEKNTAVQAANQRGEALVAAAHQETERVRQELSRERTKSEKILQYTKDTDVMQRCCLDPQDYFHGNGYVCRGGRNVARWEDLLQKFIDGRRQTLANPEAALNQEGNDTEKLQEFASQLSPIISNFSRFSAHFHIASLFQSVQKKLVSLIAQRQGR